MKKQSALPSGKADCCFFLSAIPEDSANTAPAAGAGWKHHPNFLWVSLFVNWLFHSLQ